MICHLEKFYSLSGVYVLLAVILVFCSGNGLAWADDLDPFHVEDGRWMSLDFYKEGLKENPAPDQNTSAAKQDIQPPSLAQQPSDTPKIPPSSTPVVASPSRPLDLPVMPGVNDGYAIKVNSTADDTSGSYLPNLSDSKPDLVLPEEHWKNAADFMHKNTHPSDEDAGDQHQDLDIRMSYLPNRDVKPAPEPDHPHNHGRAAHSAPAIAPSPSASSKAEAAACEAIDAYKKKQLEAIQSDRQTLAALQAAIAHLGLQKQLDFLTGANGSITNAESNLPSSKPEAPATDKP